MGIYRRYFEVAEDSPIGETMKQINLSRSAYWGELEKLKEELGAESVHFYTESGEFAGFMFDESKRDNSLWCKPTKDNLVRPRLGSKSGKAIAKRIRALPQPVSLEEIYQASGLGHGKILMFSGMTMHNASVGFRPNPFTLIVSVPWKDIDPSELEAYRKDETVTKSEMEHLLWEAPGGWEEIKEWQATKVLEEAKAAA